VPLVPLRRTAPAQEGDDRPPEDAVRGANRAAIAPDKFRMENAESSVAHSGMLDIARSQNRFFR
jgi:hypothetical protein